MKQILLIALLVMCGLACGNTVAAQTPLEVPEIEYSNDLSELRTLRRVFVHSTPDPVSRQAILKELKRENGLLEVVERPEDAEFYLVFYGSPGEGEDSFAGPEGMGQATTTGTLVAFRQVKTCDGFRPRVLFITRKSKTVHGGIALPLALTNQGGLSPLSQGGPSPRRLSKGAVSAELGVRLVLFLFGKKFPRALRFDQLNNNLSVSFDREVETQATREFLRQVKKAREEQPQFYVEPSLTPAAVTGEPAPCAPKSLPPASTDYGPAASAVINPAPTLSRLPTPSRDLDA
jgi:hypothetical protein